MKLDRGKSAALFTVVVGGISFAAGTFGPGVPQLEIPQQAAQILAGEGVACMVLAGAMLIPSRAAALIAFLLYTAATYHIWKQQLLPTTGLAIRCGLAIMLLRSFNEIRDVVRVKALQAENDRKIAEDGMRYRQAMAAPSASPMPVLRRDPTEKRRRGEGTAKFQAPEPTPERARTAKLGAGMKPKSERRMTCPNCKGTFGGGSTMCPTCSVRLYAE